jgi:hypothetical protein
MRSVKTRRDIDNARTKMSPSIGYWRDASAIAKFVGDAEVVLRIAGGQQDHHSGVLVLTNQRLLFVAGRRLWWCLALSEIRASRCDVGDLVGTVTVSAVDREYEIRSVDAKDATALVTAAGGTFRRLPRAVAIAC